MTSKVRWSLPDGVDELLAPKALEVEKLRRKLIDLYVASNYEFIIPPLLELSETLGGEAHDEISSYAFSFLDDLTGKKLSIRPISAFRPRRWKGRVVSDKSKITIKNLNTQKRPISAVADNYEVRNAKIISIKTNKKIKFNLLYDSNRSLQKKN